MGSPTKHIVDKAIEALHKRPEDFCQDTFTLTDRKSGIEFWTSNGFPMYGVYNPVKIDFGWWHGWRFARAIKKWRANALFKFPGFDKL